MPPVKKPRWNMAFLMIVDRPACAQIRPAFNLTALLWRSSRFREASQVWMPRRYPVLAAGQGEAPQEMYRSIISEVSCRALILLLLRFLFIYYRSEK